MKMRFGFVSNSSSASYLAKILETTRKEFFEILTGEKGLYKYNYDEMMKKISIRIAECKDFLKEAKLKPKNPKGNKFRDIFVKIEKKRLKDLEESKKQFAKVGDKNTSKLFALVLKYHGITAEFDDGMVKLGEFTSMHNSFNDGMSECLKEIVLTFMFDSKKKVECSWESHGN